MVASDKKSHLMYEAVYKGEIFPKTKRLLRHRRYLQLNFGRITWMVLTYTKKLKDPLYFSKKVFAKKKK